MPCTVPATLEIKSVNVTTTFATFDVRSIGISVASTPLTVTDCTMNPLGAPADAHEVLAGHARRRDEAAVRLHARRRPVLRRRVAAVRRLDHDRDLRQTLRIRARFRSGELEPAADGEAFAQRQRDACDVRVADGDRRHAPTAAARAAAAVRVAQHRDRRRDGLTARDDLDIDT